MKAVILCGGQGTRLRPLTYEIPKSLIPVHGKPVSEYLVELFKKYDCKDIILAVGVLKEKMKQYFGDGKRFGVKINYIEENVPLGTAGPLNLLKNQLSETFFVSNGDELKNIDLNEMLREHKKNNALVTIALTEVEDPSSYGVARLSDSKILEFVEKPKKEEAPSKFISSGFYIIEPEVLNYVKEGFCMFEKDVFPVIAQKGRLFGYKFKGQWFDTGTWERYEQAIKEWKGLSE